MSRPYVDKEFCHKLEEILDGLQHIGKDIDNVMNGNVTIRLRYVDILAKTFDVLNSLKRSIDRHMVIIIDSLKDLCEDHDYEKHGSEIRQEDA